MQQTIKRVFLIVITLLVIYIVQDVIFFQKRNMEGILEIRLPVFCKAEYINTHGGMLMDGETLNRLYFTDNQENFFLNQVKENIHWRKTPVTEDLYKSVINHMENLYLEIPRVENGYWIFKNRYKYTKNMYDENIRNEGNSTNYSIGVYDIDTNILYFYTLGKSYFF